MLFKLIAIISLSLAQQLYTAIFEYHGNYCLSKASASDHCEKVQFLIMIQKHFHLEIKRCRAESYLWVLNGRLCVCCCIVMFSKFREIKFSLIFSKELFASDVVHQWNWWTCSSSIRTRDDFRGKNVKSINIYFRFERLRSPFWLFCYFNSLWICCWIFSIFVRNETFFKMTSVDDDDDVYKHLFLLFACLFFLDLKHSSQQTRDDQC